MAMASQREFEFEKQAGAYETIVQWKRTGKPSWTIANRKAALQAASEKWGTDFSMVI